MQNEMDQRFNKHFNYLFNEPDFSYQFEQRLSAPELKVRENEYQYTIFVNLPGAKEENISVTLDGQRLTVKGRQDYANQKYDAMGNTVFRERRSGRFQRSINLRHPVEQNTMKTFIDNDVLTIVIPKIILRYSPN